jgi:hypothetical protein
MVRVLSMYHILLLEAEQSWTTRKWDDADLQIKKHAVSAEAFAINPRANWGIQVRVGPCTSPHDKRRLKTSCDIGWICRDISGM